MSFSKKIFVILFSISSSSCLFKNDTCDECDRIEYINDNRLYVLSDIIADNIKGSETIYILKKNKNVIMIKRFWPNGKLMVVMFFCCNKKQGNHEMFDENGKIIARYYYVKDSIIKHEIY